MAAIPAEYLDLLQQKTTFANLATIMPNGTPQVTPVWFDYTNGRIRINSKKGRVKTRNMQEGAPVALSILDPDPIVTFRSAVGSSASPKRVHRRISIPSPRNTSGRTSTPGPNLAMSGSLLKLSPPRCRSWADPQSYLKRGRRSHRGTSGGQMGQQ